MEIDFVELIHETAMETKDCNKSEPILVQLCAARSENILTNRTFSILLQSYLKMNLAEKYTVSQRSGAINFLTTRLAKNMLTYMERKRKEKEEEERKRILRELKEKYGGAV